MVMGWGGYRAMWGWGGEGIGQCGDGWRGYRVMGWV